MRPIGPENMWRILFVIFMLSFILPLISLTLFRVTTFIKSFQLEDRKERIVPFLFVASFYGISSYLFYDKINLNDVLFVVFITICLMILVLTLLSLRTKVSVHSAAIWGLFGFLYALVLKFPGQHVRELLTVFALIAGIVNSARLLLNAHSLNQIVIGGVLGFAMCFSAFYIYL